MGEGLVSSIDRIDLGSSCIVDYIKLFDMISSF